jgi:hypothetical protein
MQWLNGGIIGKLNVFEKLDVLVVKYVVET